MRKDEDFFRITFKRDQIIIKKFEQNISHMAKQTGISRPMLVAILCNHLMDNGCNLSMNNGIWQVNTPKVESEPKINYTEPKPVEASSYEIDKSSDLDNIVTDNTTVELDASTKMLMEMGLL